MTVLTVTITDPTFDKKSAEATYPAGVLDLVKQKLQAKQGTLTGSQNVLGTVPQVLRIRYSRLLPTRQARAILNRGQTDGGQ